VQVPECWPTILFGLERKLMSSVKGELLADVVRKRRQICPIDRRPHSDPNTEASKGHAAVSLLSSGLASTQPNSGPSRLIRR
jgi:hypothetical protein